MGQVIGGGPAGETGSPGRGLVLIVVVGAILGLAYNAIGQHMTGTWGLAWLKPVVAEDEAAGVDYEISDDPMAIPPAATDAPLPEIPELDRPIQMQLPVVKKFFDEGAALFIDSREPADHALGHIPGSLNLPYEEVITDPVRLAEVDSGGRPIITYCSGGSCEASTGLAWELLANGHSRVLVFHGGWPAWEEAGYPVATLGDEAAVAASGVAASLLFAAAFAALVLVAAGLLGRGPGMARLNHLLRSPALVRIAALAIGVIMGVAGMAKIGDLPSFAKQIGNFHLIPGLGVHLAAVTLPWVELVLAMALILGIRRRAGGLLAVVLMVVFTVAVAQAAARGFDIECGCFGTADSSTVGLEKLAENVALLAVALVAAVRPR